MIYGLSVYVSILKLSFYSWYVQKEDKLSDNGPTSLEQCIIALVEQRLWL